MVVEMDVAVNHILGFGKGRGFVSVDALSFENREKVFGHGIVMAVPTS